MLHLAKPGAQSSPQESVGNEENPRNPDSEQWRDGLLFHHTVHFNVGHTVEKATVDRHKPHYGWNVERRLDVVEVKQWTGLMARLQQTCPDHSDGAEKQERAEYAPMWIGKRPPASESKEKHHGKHRPHDKRPDSIHRHKGKSHCNSKYAYAQCRLPEHRGLGKTCKLSIHHIVGIVIRACLQVKMPIRGWNLRKQRENQTQCGREHLKIAPQGCRRRPSGHCSDAYHKHLRSRALHKQRRHRRIVISFFWFSHSRVSQ